MRLAKILLATAVCALSASPALAQSPHAPDNHGKAYGKYCQTQSKKHVKGQKGTPFSQCVTAMAKLASGETASPRSACKALSHKRVDGQKGTPFSKCVSGGARLLRDRG